MNTIESRINEMKAKAEVLEFIKSRLDYHTSSALDYQQRASEDDNNDEWYRNRSIEEQAIADAFLEIAKLIK